MATSSRNRAFREEEEDCSSFFPVPCELVKSYGGVMPSKVALTTDESEKRWRLSVEKFDGQYLFTSGWKEFEQEMGSKAHELLMYKPVDSSKLKGGNKEIGMKRSGNAHESTRSRLNKIKFKSSGAEKILSFCKEMKRYHRYGLNFPMEFSIVIEKATSGLIKLKDHEGRMWPVQLVKDDKFNFLRMTVGWIDFLEGNKVSVGSTVFFKTIPNCDDVIKARVIEGANKQKELFAKKARGRPFSRSKLPETP